MEPHGNEILYDGRTGRQMKTEIFIGPTYYQRLKHMVMDKIHTRGSSGPIILLTRQPSEGRSRNGGLRLGEMERDAIISHGTSMFLKERMLDVSDASRQYICKKCGMHAIANPEKNLYKCVICKNEADITQIRIPYAFKLLSQELATMNIQLRYSI
jgi:DNA-directed RNA polymerase II subunit RPB2